MDHIYLVLFALVILNCSCNYKKEIKDPNDDQSKIIHCKDFRQGLFELSDEEGRGITQIIERSGNLHIETNTLTEEKTVFEVLWINDCVAHLTIKEAKPNVYNFYKDKILIMQIEETDKEENSYIFSTKLRGDESNIFYQKAINIEC